MKKIVVRLFAVIGFLTVALIASLITLGVYATKSKQSAPETMVLAINFNAPIGENEEMSPLDLALSDDVMPLTDILRAIDRAKSDPSVKALVGKFGSTQPSLAHAQEIRASIKNFRDSKKPTYAFGTSYGQFGGAGKAYFLASAFETLWLQPVGSVGLNGPAIQSPFFREALDKLGVKADFLQRDEYKSFMDMATHNDFTAPVKANLESLLSDLSGQMERGLSESKGWDAARTRQAMDHGPYTDREALQAGLVSRLGYEDELEQTLKDTISKDVKIVGPRTYLGYQKAAAAAAEGKASKTTRIALIKGMGAIVEHASEGESLAGDTVMGADDIVEAFNAVIEEEDIKAVLFRIDSPGGSPEASESIRRAVVRAQKAGKPVIVSMGSVAASGGYWATMNAERIIANPGTLTGSIGVVAGKFAIGPALEKLGIRFSTVTSRPAPGSEADGKPPKPTNGMTYETMWSMDGEFTPAQRERVTAMIDRTYQAFLENVAEARKLPLDKMKSLAGGRVYTGEQAQKLGLVDALGGYKAALAAVREKLKLEPAAPVEFVLLPAPDNTIEKLLKLIQNVKGEGANVALPIAAVMTENNPTGALWRETVRALRMRGALETRLPFAETLIP